MEEAVNHIRLSFKEGELAIIRAIVSGKEITIKKPVKPMNGGDETNFEIWKS